jgi:septum formation topological specificity factor MinE
LPGGEFIENIASDRFKIILRNLERYSGKPIRSLRDIAIDLMDVIQKIDQIESQHISELEDLAVSLIEQHFGIDPREVGFDAKLVRNVTIGDITNISPEEEKSIEESLSTSNIDLEVSKRRFINGLIKGQE